MNVTVTSPRSRLFGLWLAAFARAVAAAAVQTYAVMKVSNGWSERQLGFLFIWLGLAAVPAFALAPLIGAIASSRGRWTVMVLATLAGLGIVAWSSIDEHQAGTTFWPGCVAVIAFESAFFAAGRFGVLPEAARATRLSLSNVVGAFTIALGGGTLIGVWLGIERFQDGKPGLPVPLQAALIGYGVALIALLLSRFPVANPVRFNDGLMIPFLKTARAIWRDPYGRYSFITLIGLFLIDLAVQQWLLPREEQTRFFAALTIGLALGSVNRRQFRTLGLVPVAVIGLVVGTLIGCASGDWPYAALAIAFFSGLMYPPLLTTYTVHQPDNARGHGAALLHAGGSLAAALLLSFLLLWLADAERSRVIVGRAVLVLAILLTILCWLVFVRPLFESLVEIAFWPMYRFQKAGPGLPVLPWKGPVLIIANHTALFDPIWLNKILPCPVTPMMTSKFYDKPFVSFLVRHFVGAIRVPDVAVRKDAPELKQAIAALDRGECVVIFPEGWLRRKENQELRRFGRGIWKILQERPQTPIFACWIEGGWGSMVSYKGGAPLTHKKWDFWRSIRIGSIEPFTIDPETLANHLATRGELMRKVIEARACLGLPPIDPAQLPHSDDDAKEDA